MQTPSSDRPRWTFACSRCDWIGTDPVIHFFVRNADCPDCGNSCSSDEPEFEPRAGTLDGTAVGFDPVPRSDNTTSVSR
jgi:hypothetical protein